MKLEVQGIYKRHTINPLPSGKYAGKMAGDVIIEIDNSYTTKAGEHIQKLTEVPFGAFGAPAEKVANEYQPGDRVVVTFSLEGYHSDNTGRDYSKNRLAFINHVSGGNQQGYQQQQNNPYAGNTNYGGGNQDSDMPF